MHIAPSPQRGEGRGEGVLSFKFKHRSPHRLCSRCSQAGLPRKGRGEFYHAAFAHSATLLLLPACGEKVGMRGRCRSAPSCDKAPSPELLRNSTSPRAAGRGEHKVPSRLCGCLLLPLHRKKCDHAGNGESEYPSRKGDTLRRAWSPQTKPRGLTMCDFSLQHAKSRPAVVADKLVSHNFGRGTVGFKQADAPIGDERRFVYSPAPSLPSTSPSSFAGPPMRSRASEPSRPRSPGKGTRTSRASTMMSWKCRMASRFSDPSRGRPDCNACSFRPLPRRKRKRKSRSEPNTRARRAPSPRLRERRSG